MTNSEYRQPTHREELERELVHGAASQIAHAPENAAAIAKGIKTVLDELAPVASTSCGYRAAASHRYRP